MKQTQVTPDTNLNQLVGTATAAPDTNRNFIAPLSGREEVPLVETTATGVAIFHLSKDGSELSYKRIVSNIEDVT